MCSRSVRISQVPLWTSTIHPCYTIFLVVCLLSAIFYIASPALPAEDNDTAHPPALIAPRNSIHSIHSRAICSTDSDLSGLRIPKLFIPELEPVEDEDPQHRLARRTGKQSFRSQACPPRLQNTSTHTLHSYPSSRTEGTLAHPCTRLLPSRFALDLALLMSMVLNNFPSSPINHTLFHPHNTFDLVDWRSGIASSRFLRIFHE